MFERPSEAVFTTTAVLDGLLPIRETLASALEHATAPDRPDLERATDEVSSLVRLQAALQRAALRPPSARSCEPLEPPRRGIGPISR
jgi:hypothetical protein